ncbi:MAG: Hsp70 family protein, partial [FCB group bacterium]|nr:Hsp70 family protein [FCB group bacterium]
MGYFIGIDLGTTNSSICSYDENDTRVWKSPDQNDVTPSVIFTDRRGNQYVGKRAYDSAPQSPENAAMLFKRYMGTNTPIKIEAIDKTVTPEECSAEVLKVLFGYLNEEIRNDSKCGSVITVPAAFNQMQKNATLEAAKLAGIGKVALMQEPVAAVMSVMRNRDSDGMFLVYDLGGGTLDIAIAESMGGRVSLISHGGIQMCGGRDIDKLIYGELVIPWLNDNFELPEVLNSQKKYAKLERLALWSIERAKIELSARLDTSINLSEEDTRLQDLSGNDIYLEIPLTRSTLDSLIDSLIDETIDAGKEIIKNAGLSASDIERIVFIGGPTNYKPLRDKVSSDLGIPGSAEINPMTAVAIGASLFAESVNWDSVKKDKKSTRGQIGTEGDFSIGLHYTSRTPQLKALLVVKLTGQLESGATFQIDSLDTGWTSGRIPLEQDAKLDLSLPKTGENKFKAFIFNSSGDPVSLENNSIIITRTTATVDAIPASHSIGIEVLDKLGGRPVLEWLVKSGDPLPKKGKMSFKAGELLKAGSTNSLNFKLWEGELYEPISDNRPIGVMKITGNDFDEGVIPAGSSLDCEYEISDSGNIEIIVSVPSIGGTFDSKRNFYSRQEGQIDFSSASALVAEEGEKVSERIEEINDQITDPRLDKAMDKL